MTSTSQTPLLLHEQYPYIWYRTMRESPSTAVFLDEQKGIWSVFRYEDVRAVLTDTDTFSSNFSSADEATGSLSTTDPPRHRVLRSLINQAFTPRTIAALAPYIESLVNELLDAVIDNGQMDVVQALSIPLPARVISYLLGVPREDHAQLHQWIQEFLVEIGKGEGYPKKQTAMLDYFKQLVQQRRQHPQDDLISQLIAVQENEERLDNQQVVSLCLLLYMAGSETTTHLISNAILCFDQQPDLMNQLQASPDLLPSAIEEVLRYHPPMHGIYRRVAKDTIFQGKEMRAGQLLIPYLASANHDETVFPQPNQFNITRSPNRHLTFSYGIHFCLGAPLARLEAAIALRILLERCRDIRRENQDVVEYTPSFAIRGPRHLPITFRAYHHSI